MFTPFYLSRYYELGRSSPLSDKQYGRSQLLAQTDSLSDFIKVTIMGNKRHWKFYTFEKFTLHFVQYSLENSYFLIILYPYINYTFSCINFVLILKNFHCTGTLSLWSMAKIAEWTINRYLLQRSRNGHLLLVWLERVMPYIWNELICSYLWPIILKSMTVAII